MSPEPLSDRVTRLEVLFENLGKQIGRELEVAGKVHEDLEKSIEMLTDVVDRLDKRQDKTDLRFAYAAGAIAVSLMLFQLFAPLIRDFIGLPNT